MTDFKYVGNVSLGNPANFKEQGSIAFLKPNSEVGDVKNVEFLTPIQVKIEIDGVEKAIRAHVDLVNKELFVDGFSQEAVLKIKEAVFRYLDKKNYIEPNSFEAKEAIAELTKRMGEMANKESRRHSGS